MVVFVAQRPPTRSPVTTRHTACQSRLGDPLGRHAMRFFTPACASKYGSDNPDNWSFSHSIANASSSLASSAGSPTPGFQGQSGVVSIAAFSDFWHLVPDPRRLAPTANQASCPHPTVSCAKRFPNTPMHTALRSKAGNASDDPEQQVVGGEADVLNQVFDDRR